MALKRNDFELQKKQLKKYEDMQKSIFDHEQIVKCETSKFNKDKKKFGTMQKYTKKKKKTVSTKLDSVMKQLYYF